jgi:hypothetical protein
MVAGADSIDDLALLRHGGMKGLFTACYAPSTLGSFLRAFTFGHVRQLDAVASRFLTNPGTRPGFSADPGPKTSCLSMLTTRSSRSTATKSRVPATEDTRGSAAWTPCWPRSPPRTPPRGMVLARRFAPEAHHIRGTLAYAQLDHVATLWTRRKPEPNREHALDVLADSWFPLLCDAD